MALVEDVSRGLGLMGEYEGESEWHGGKIQQIARLAEPTRGNFVVQLERMEMRRSNRFARFLGSRRMLLLRVGRDLVMKQGDAVRAFCLHKFVLCGRVFVPFHAKDSSVYMMETNENYERSVDMMCGDQHRISFDAFIDWHNPLEHNRNQVKSSTPLIDRH